ncbi:unnamed protein product [Discula destructiva]
MTDLKTNYGASQMEVIFTSSSGPEWQKFMLQPMEAISGPLARNMLDLIGLNATTTTPFRMLDHGCGLGIVAPALLVTVPQNVLEESTILCGDFSAPLVERVRERIKTEVWAGVEARVVDAQDSGLPSESFTHVVSNIMYHTVPDSQRALTDSIRLLTPGGTLAFTTWHACNPAWAVDVRDAFATIPAALLPSDYVFRAPMQTTAWGHWYDVDWVRDVLAVQHGLADVRVEVLANTWPVHGVGHFMRMFEKLLGPVAGMVLGEKTVAKLGGEEGVQTLVEGFLKEKYGEKEWTATGLSICAWGTKPMAGSSKT